MRSFIVKATDCSFYCEKCREDIKRMKNKEDMYCENLYTHISSSLHARNVNPNEADDHKGLIDVIEARTTAKKLKKAAKKSLNHILSDDKENEDFLEFVTF